MPGDAPDLGDPPGWTETNGLSAEAWGAVTALLGWSPPDVDAEEEPAWSHAALMEAVIRPWPDGEGNLILTGGQGARGGRDSRFGPGLPPMSGGEVLRYSQLRRENSELAEGIRRLVPGWREDRVDPPAATGGLAIRQEINRQADLRQQLERAQAGLPPVPGIGHNRPPPDQVITVPGAPPPPAPAPPVIGPGGIIDRPASPAEISLMGELFAYRHLRARRYTDIVVIRNNSGHGVDIFAVSPSGQRVAFEVKSTTGDRVPPLSRDQQRPEVFVRDRLGRAANEDGAWASAPSGTAERARDLLRSLEAGERFETRRLDVFMNPDLSLREPVREREWRDVE
jgi:hypothetical protein